MKHLLSLLVILFSALSLQAQSTDPITILPQSGMAVNNTPYSFTQNGITVTTTVGAQSNDNGHDYFGCNAGQSITFSAAQAIKGIVVNGFVKKDFSASVNHGTIEYVDASADAVEADPVIVITDINSASVTISCVKQLRCYSVEVYFDANPDTEIGGGDDGQYSYDWEPTTPNQFNLVMTEAEAIDMAESLGYNAVYLTLDNSDAELNIVIFAPADETTIVPVGTYPFSDSYVEGTAEASVGGDDDYDYESYLMTNYETVGGIDYYDPYYIVSGAITVTTTEITIDAISYHGSTIHAVYAFDNTPVNEQQQTSLRPLRLHHGRISLLRGNHTYDLRGTKVK